MNLLLFLFLLSALTSGLLLCVLKLRAQAAPKNRRRPPQLDWQRSIQRASGARRDALEQQGRVIYGNLQTHFEPNGKTPHERNRLP